METGQAPQQLVNTVFLCDVMSVRSGCDDRTHHEGYLWEFVRLDAIAVVLLLVWW